MQYFDMSICLFSYGRTQFQMQNKRKQQCNLRAAYVSITKLLNEEKNLQVWSFGFARIKWKDIISPSKLAKEDEEQKTCESKPNCDNKFQENTSITTIEHKKS